MGTSTVRISDAQAQRIEAAHLHGSYGICDQSWQGEVHERHVIHALVHAGLMQRAGLSPTDPSITLFELTDAGRRAYATNGRVNRVHRCDNPVCCGTWPTEDKTAPPTHGACPVCFRWIAVTKSGEMKRHTDRPGRLCSGIGQPREGLAP